MILLARAVTWGPLVKMAWETAVQVLSGIEVGEMVGLLLGLKATARICSSRMWSTSQRSPFPGFWVGLGEISRAGCVGKDGEGGGGVDRAGVKLVPCCCRLL